MDYAFKYTEKNPLETEDDYPYRAVDGTCNFDEKKGKVASSGYKDVVPNDIG